MKKRSFIWLLFIVAFIPKVKAQGNESLYEKAYTDIVAMLEDSTKYSFKKAVFSVEDAYLHGQLDTFYINYEIKKLTKLANGIIQNNHLKDYEYRDKDEVLKYASLFSVMTDTIPLVIDGDDYNYIPYRYDFEDIWGEKEWSNMFVSKLLLSGKGNCHSLPYLYKILAEEIDVEAHLALAPNHIYIKHRNERDGWYNTELTSGIFPIDAWIMASGYVHLDGIRSGMYMKALTDKESLSLVLTDLAHSYDKQIEYHDGSFVLKCTETALKYYPNNINALLLKLETTKVGLERMAQEKGVEFEEVFQYPKAREIWQNLNNQVRQIHELGYRQMPKEMYLDWLVSLKEEKEKYTNKKISTFKQD